MSAAPQQQFGRKASLLMVGGSRALDLSDMHFRFEIRQGDVATPNNALIRVWNLRPETMKQIRGEFARVVVQAGYEGSFGVVFDGTVKQFGIGKESAVDSFLDIKAAEGDIGFTTGLVSKSYEAGTKIEAMMTDSVIAMGLKLVNFATLNVTGDLSRGRVLFGMARAHTQALADTLGATWSIQGGEVQVIPLTKYLDGDAVVINSMTGMVGIPEQTPEGVKVRCLLNPKIKCGSRIRLNNGDITQQDIKSIVPFNVKVGTVFSAPLAAGADGDYRVLVHDVSGDTRGQEFYSDIIALAIRQSSADEPVAPYG